MKIERDVELAGQQVRGLQLRAKSTGDETVHERLRIERRAIRHHLAPAQPAQSIDEQPGAHRHRDVALHAIEIDVDRRDLAHDDAAEIERRPDRQPADRFLEHQLELLRAGGRLHRLRSVAIDVEPRIGRRRRARIDVGQALESEATQQDRHHRLRLDSQA